MLEARPRLRRTILWTSAFALAACSEAPARTEPRAASSIVTDSVLLLAADAVAKGRPWRATLLLEPLLADSASRTPEAELIAARAAAGWSGWDRVRGLLERARWLEQRFGGEGHELLARAALARRQDSLAYHHASRAVALGRPGPVLGHRQILLARAAERLTNRDSVAAAAYRAAIDHLPSIGDWLRLRAAGVTHDRAARFALYDSVRLAPARSRIRWTEAYALERSGFLMEASRAFDSLAAHPDALRLRVAAAVAAADSSELRSAREALLAIVRSRPASGDARAATELLDRHFAPLAAAEEIVVARSAARVGPRDRAVRGYERAIAGRLASAQDRFDYATLLSRAGRDAEAAREFARVTAPADLAATAAYQRARSLLRSRNPGATAALQRVVARYPRSDAAGSALYLLGDLATDEGSDQRSRARFLELARRYPRHPLTSSARLRAAIAAFASGQHGAAARELDTLIRRDPRGPESAAARYWSGRAWAAAGNRSRARTRWREVLEQDSLSYYAQLAARRLDTIAWSPPPPRDSGRVDDAIVEAFARAERLEHAGMSFEARLEFEALAAEAHESLAGMLSLGEAFRERGMASRAIQLGTRALARGAPRDARTYRLLYPMLYDDLLLEHARRHGLDPALVAALTRQESHFEPRATSVANARGLMQVLPSVGRQLARRSGFPTWSDELLYEPEVNIHLGTAHLASVLTQYGDTARALAAYNAGGTRVRRWATRRGTDDPELFVERIPYVETRDYVRVIQRTRAWYRALYGWRP